MQKLFDEIKFSHSKGIEYSLTSYHINFTFNKFYF